MEGLSNPAKQKELLKFVFLSSDLYEDKIKKRFSVTQDVLKKNLIEYLVYSPQSGKRLSQVFETLIFGSFTVYYLTKLYGIDPLEIPWVNYFKKQLAK
jgi:glucose/mannose-6-phosphate isomerase